MNAMLRTAGCLAFVTLLGCGPAHVGDSCDSSGSTSECVDGAICTANPSGSGATCWKLCVDDTQCSPAEHCNGVSGSNLKSCQP